MNDNSIHKMTNEEIDEELALLRGWKKKDDFSWELGHYSYWEDAKNTHHVLEYDWHPTQSLDQCHEIEEEKIRGNEKFEHLYSFILEWKSVESMDEDCKKAYHYCVFEIARLSPRQKSEALLETLREVK